MSKLLTVFGATGQQGGSLINHVLNRKKLSDVYDLRGITRDVSKPAALKLTEQGVKMVQADMDDPTSLQKAVEGSDVIFAMTDYWEKASADNEIAQGKAIADACIAAGVHLIIWSTLPDVPKMSNGTLTKVHHFNTKVAVEEHIRSLPIKSIFYMPAGYMSLFQGMMKPRKDENGDIVFSPSFTNIPLIDIRDTGKFLEPALLQPHLYYSKTFTAASGFYSGEEMARVWTDVTGKKVTYEQVPVGSMDLPGMPPHMAEALKEIGGLIRDYGYYGETGREDLKWTLEQMEEKPKSWREFVEDAGPWFSED